LTSRGGRSPAPGAAPGCDGGSLSAGRGAWAATQEDDPRFRGRKVVSISGDGGFGRYMGELTTAVKYGMDITHVPLRKDPLGKITGEQRAGTWKVRQTSLRNPGSSEYARICGAKGFLAAARDDLDAALEEALGRAGPIHGRDRRGSRAGLSRSSSIAARPILTHGCASIAYRLRMRGAGRARRVTSRHPGTTPMHGPRSPPPKP